MIGRVRESRNPKKVIRVTLMESYGEIGRVPVNLFKISRIECKKDGENKNKLLENVWKLFTKDGN